MWYKHVHVFMYTYVFISHGHIAISGIAVSYGNSLFKFLGVHQAIFQSGCTILQLHQQYLGVLISSQYLIVVLFYVSLMANAINIFSCAHRLFISFLWKNVYSYISLFFFNWFILLSYNLYIFWIVVH